MAYGTPAPLVVSLATSNTCSRSFEATGVRDATFAGGDSFSDGMTLTVDVDMILKDSIEVRKKSSDLA
jgi:hypothetical protein